MKKIRVWLGFALLALVLGACGQKTLSVENAWARPGITGNNSAVYFVINNPTGTEDVLLSASTPAAEGAEMHMSLMDENGVMQMQQQASVPVPARGEVEFQPGSLHVMLINLPQDLNTGETISLTLTFQNAGAIELSVPVCRTSC
jgi:copper(I)-binding protein